MSIVTQGRAAMTLGTVFFVLLIAAVTLRHNDPLRHREDEPLLLVHAQIRHSPNRMSGYTTTPQTSQELHATFREPNTPPESLPSDPFAQYIYQEELDRHRRPLFAPRVHHKPRRTIIVGDVHGSLDGLNRFLGTIQFDTQRDLLVLAGDLVAKGPQSLEVIDRARQLKAKCVRGNHEDKIIRWRGYLDSLAARERDAFMAETESEAEDDDDDEYDDNATLIREFSREEEEGQMNSVEQLKGKQSPKRAPSDLDKRSEHYRIARAMTKEQYDYIRNCPLILTLPRELSVRNVPVHIVHAGIDPRHNILKQQPWVLVNVRNVLKDGTPSRKKSKGKAWAKAFNDLHTRKSSTDEDFLVVYGHDAGRSLNVQKWSIGLDTGCVYGRELTGYVVETGDIVSVPCPRI
ncbi:hypothetical protein BGX28_003513 [Mortierella sp. GBA30]|nr:hypothetical protein BGX28_003513 [Mortierella sp. GBA30]